MKILKAINNNIVSARDENGKEIVVMGRGIGFKCREGDSIPPEAIEKIFHMDTQNETDRLKQLFSSMPLEHIEVTNRIIAYARKILGKRLNHSIYITLTDHISFSVLRFRQNMMFHNALLAEMRRFYPQEYSIGQYALDLCLLYTSSARLCPSRRWRAYPPRRAQNQTDRCFQRCGRGVPI